MRKHVLFCTLALLAAATAIQSAAQTPPTVRLRGVIAKVDGHTALATSDKGAEIKLNLADKILVVEVVKASMADIKPGDFIGSGAMPQPDGTQKAIEVHIYDESMRGTAEGFREWDGAPNSTMTNGTVGSSVAAVHGHTIVIKYKGGEKTLIVTPDVPVVRYEIGDLSAIKPGAAFSVTRAVKKADESYDIARINVGRAGIVPR